MNSDGESFLMCFAISAISIFTSFIPKKFVLKIYGISMGLAAGALCAVLFADLFPDLLHEFVEEFEGKKHSKQVYWARIYSGILLAGVFLGGVVEAVVHFFMPHDHCHGNAAGHCKHGQEHHHSMCLEDAEKIQSQSHVHGHGHGHGRLHGHSDVNLAESDGVKSSDGMDSKQIILECHGHSHGHSDVNLAEYLAGAKPSEGMDTGGGSQKENEERLQSLQSVDLENPDHGDMVESTEEEEQESFSFKNWFSKFIYIPSHVWLYTICRAFHLVSDGVVIGLTREWIIVLGLLAHELPHCLGSYGFYINYKVSKSHSIFLLLSSCIGFFIGNGLVLLIPNIESVKLYLLSIIIGMFLYVVFLIIIPETMDFKDKKDALYRFLTFIISLVLISAMIYKFHNHGDEVNPQAATSGNVQSGHGGHGHGHGGHGHGHGCHH